MTEQFDLEADVAENFDAIRPFYDDEVPAILARLTHNDEFVDTVARYRLSRLFRHCRPLARFLARQGLRRAIRGVNSIRDFQRHIAVYMDRMIDQTTETFEVAGLEQLADDTAYLFIGNHRDIALDPAFVNYALYQAGRDTVRIAIGDNLLQKPFVTDLMRLNKSFIVPRSSRGKREMIAAYQQLSCYIRHSLIAENHSVWLAQREGRAKNGVDRTDAAIIKMLGMARRQRNRDALIGESIRELRLVPVSISYEYDPCDMQKARELKAVNEGGRYEKTAYEDILSIAAGITGNKGRVRLVFGTPVGTAEDTLESLTAEIDRQVMAGYTLFPSHYLALEATGHAPDLIDHAAITDADRQRFQARLAEVPAELRDYWLCQYANPVLNRAGYEPL
ncbi:1-acyl-sn-glycerol-3-phosphate acyltransferase [Kushneria phosphatilytica]|uniref:Glycerol acyltransferase n=1 Tax=Kushneria phosphatilytica TaxID=657387 RepID=A0A1S1NWN1_9GAMM|nr:1-acyl-sn-glycerol-3-phosphate acyltransferase [Kushneria phosphatilytica]OHV12371.1 glycerol acyltransferase [Kushneria phosphatilytica]QEL11406.1 glycerol acyltransferase [Kushneria phosphatilytica]